MKSQERVADILLRLLAGEKLTIAGGKRDYDVTERTLQRDLAVIRGAVERNNKSYKLMHSFKTQQYQLVKTTNEGGGKL